MTADGSLLSGSSWAGSAAVSFFLFFLSLSVFLIFSCGMWDLVPQPGVEPGPLCWEYRVSATGSQGAPVLPFKSTSSASSSLPAQQDQAAIRWPQAPVGRQVLCTCVTAAALNVSIQITCLATENASSADSLKEAFFAE